MKICTKCKQEKLLEEFSPSKKSPDGKHSWCKSCKSLAMRIRHKKYPWKMTFNNVRTRCNNPKFNDYKDYGGRGIKCLLIEEEVKALWFRDKAYEMKQPSIDRINNDGNYCLENCRFIEQGENSAERNTRISSKPVNQYDINGNFIRSWSSAAEAEKTLGMSQSHISKVCLGKAKTSHKSKWEFAKKKGE